MNVGVNHAPGAGLIADLLPAVQCVTTVLRLPPLTNDNNKVLKSIGIFFVKHVKVHVLRM